MSSMALTPANQDFAGAVRESFERQQVMGLIGARLAIVEAVTSGS